MQSNINQKVYHFHKAASEKLHIIYDYKIWKKRWRKRWSSENKNVHENMWKFLRSAATNGKSRSTNKVWRRQWILTLLVRNTTETFWCQGSSFFPFFFFDKGYLVLLPKHMHPVLHSTDKELCSYNKSWVCRIHSWLHKLVLKNVKIATLQFWKIK